MFSPPLLKHVCEDAFFEAVKKYMYRNSIKNKCFIHSSALVIGWRGARDTGPASNDNACANCMAFVLSNREKEEEDPASMEEQWTIPCYLTGSCQRARALLFFAVSYSSQWQSVSDATARSRSSKTDSGENGMRTFCSDDRFWGASGQLQSLRAWKREAVVRQWQNMGAPQSCWCSGWMYSAV